jgi:hypothetical protein
VRSVLDERLGVLVPLEDDALVKTHVRNIYAKLQARDRFLAVQRARELRLLAAGPAG